MKLSVVFPNVLYREGPEGVRRFIRGVEQLGFDELDMFDHVLMGYPTQTRRAPFYSPTMPIMEAFMLLSYAAALTDRIGLGTGVLVLPQRQPALVAKQAGTLDILSAGRLRLGVGTGWQRAEYEALQCDFDDRGQRMDEAISLLRAYWQDETVDFEGRFYAAHQMAMEPKPVQRPHIPIWVGGTKAPALRRVAQLADGWMAMSAPGDPPLEQQLQTLRGQLESAGRDPDSIGLQMSLSPDALNKEQRKRFYAEPQMICERLVQLRDMGFGWASIDCVPIFQQGYRSSAAIIEYLAEVYEVLQPELHSASGEA